VAVVIRFTCGPITSATTAALPVASMTPRRPCGAARQTPATTPAACRRGRGGSVFPLRGRPPRQTPGGCPFQ
jgi:hypothetical protein